MVEQEPGVPSPRGLLVSASCAPHTHAATSRLRAGKIFVLCKNISILPHIGRAVIMS